MKTNRLKKSHAFAAIFHIALAISISSVSFGAAVESGTLAESQAPFRPVSNDLTWTDTARGREIPVRIYAPPVEDDSGTFPLVVFSHGGGESREAFDYLGTYWASHGYIAVFLTHRGSDRQAIRDRSIRSTSGGGVESFHLRPEDVRFVLDRLLSGASGSPLVDGRVDKEKVAAAGQCAGSSTALAMVGLDADVPGNTDNAFVDPRFSCVIALSPQPGMQRGSPLHADSWSRIEVPALVITGTRDFNWTAQARATPNHTRIPFDGMPSGDKYLVEIKDAEHNAFTDSVPYYPARKRDPRHHHWIQQATTAFLDAYLKGDQQMLMWLQQRQLQAETDGECKQDDKLDASQLAAPVKPAPRMQASASSQLPAAQDRVERLLALFDKNDDGALSKEEAPARLKSIFDRIDRNLDGLLEQSELGPVLNRGQQENRSTWRPANRDRRIITTNPGLSSGVAVIETCVLHDSQREKDLTLRITYPEAMGRFPVILFAHAVKTSRSDFIPLVSHWAANGYIVLQADHADTEQMNVDWMERARDLRFIIDSLDEIGSRVPGLAERMDPGKIGVSGHLIGSYAASSLVGMKGRGFGEDSQSDEFSDKRVDAAMLLAPQGTGQQLDKHSWEDIDKPMLVATGSRMPSRRTSNPAEWRTEPFQYASPGDKYLLWVDGMDTRFAGLYDGENRDPLPAKLIEEMTTAFWDAYLKGDPAAREHLKDWPLPAELANRVRIETKLTASDAAPDNLSRSPDLAAGAMDFSRLDQFLERSLDRFGGGCSFLIIQGDKVIHRKAYGSFKPEQVVPIASSSKWLSGGVIMALVDRGVISLDDTASQYLPYFTGKKADITIRQMFSHTHCLTGNAREHLYNTSLTMDEAVRKIAECDLIADPGTALYYSGLGMQVAARICEIATGKPWVEIFKEVLGNPLEMNHTTYYAFGPTKNPNVAGGIRTCVDDYGNYLNMLLNNGVFKGRRVLSEEAIQTMFSIQSGIHPILRHAYDVLDVVDPKLAVAPYGIGCWLEDYDPDTGETTVFTSGGGFGCMPFIDRKRNIAGIFLPHNRKGKLDAKGRRYNDAHRVYYEAKAIIDKIMDTRSKEMALRKPALQAVDNPVVEVHGDRAADYSARNGGRAVLVMADGKTVYERYDNGFGPETATHLHSATKGFWGPVIAAMIEDGLVDSFDELASKTIREWRGHPRKGKITLRNLLSLNAGLVQDVANLQGHDRPTLADDLYKHAIGVAALREPGTQFQYGPSCYYVLGEIMKRKLAPRRETPLDYLQWRILDPIGVQVDAWVQDASGNPHIPNGASLTAREWIQFGQWLLQGGEWSGQQVVSKHLLDELVQPSGTNPGHGLALWLNCKGGHGAYPAQSAPPDKPGGFIYHDGLNGIYAALGAGKCRLYVIPELKIVALRQGDSEKDRYLDNTFLSLLLTGK